MRHWNATISTPARRERDRRSGESGLETERGRKKRSQRERLYDDRRWNVEEEKEMIGLQQRIIKSTLVN